MGQVQIAYDFPKETVTATIMLYWNTKAKAHQPNGGIDFFNIEAGVLQGDTFIIFLDYVCQISIYPIR